MNNFLVHIPKKLDSATGGIKNILMPSYFLAQRQGGNKSDELCSNDWQYTG